MSELRDENRAEELRNKTVDQLVADGTITSARVEAALRKVPRHIAVPEVPVEKAYSVYEPVVTKQDEHGVHTSSVSAPQIQAMQLEQADIQPGDRVLEIGTNGPNAAYIAELAGPTGQVTTVDIDPAPADRAQRFLDATGYTGVRVLVGDAEYGVPDRAPFDAILVTAGAWDIPPAWIAQLNEGGRLVVPLRVNSLTRTYRFVREGDHLVSTSAHVCGFVPMQGDGAHRQETLLLRGNEEIALRFDEALPVEPSLLNGVLITPRAEVWTGVTVGRTELIGGLQLYLATMLPGFCTMAVDPDLDTGVVKPNNPAFSMAAVDGPNFAYLLVRRTPDDKNVEYGIHAFGPDRDKLAEQIRDLLRTWAKQHRGGPGPRLTVHPADTPDDRIPGDRIFNKKHSRISISWPTA
ncbi:methyltransferase, FxLD system [Streptomyces sp. F63]|uniref:methyltransferase, FxLD system n=1 Tax=Streptomyces sp. F63 TaxID=2824887 RepID=UPI001B366011|nr:methyltransferase, FxLD system [Streptomyces sp. F63]MBQ0983725.1 methyltransferase, FxLD system [Streptomyces sp. F63]